MTDNHKEGAESEASFVLGNRIGGGEYPIKIEAQAVYIIQNPPKRERWDKKWWGGLILSVVAGLAVLVIAALFAIS